SAAPLEGMAKASRYRQIPVEPVELRIEFVQNPLRRTNPVKIPGRLEEAGLHPARRMDQRGHETHIHGIACGAGAPNSLHSACRKRFAAPWRRQSAAKGRLRVMRSRIFLIA